MLPFFIYSYKDKSNYIHLYFYPGLDDNDNKIYRDIELTHVDKYKYSKFNNVDGSIEYIFENSNIIAFNCILYKLNSNKEIRKKILVK